MKPKEAAVVNAVDEPIAPNLSFENPITGQYTGKAKRGAQKAKPKPKDKRGAQKAKTRQTENLPTPPDPNSPDVVHAQVLEKLEQHNFSADMSKEINGVVVVPLVETSMIAQNRKAIEDRVQQGRSIVDILREATQELQPAPDKLQSLAPVCPYCNCCANQIMYSLIDPWNPIWHNGRIHFKNLFNFDVQNVCICIMHAFERLVEAILERSTKGYIEARLFAIQFYKALKKGHLKNEDKKFWPGNIYLTLKDKEYDPDDPQCIWTRSKFGMIPWKFCRIIKSTGKQFLTALNSFMKELKGIDGFVSEEEFVLWQQLEEIWNIVHATEETVQTWKTEGFETQKVKLEEFGKRWLVAYPTFLYSFYLHIVVCHTVELWNRFGSLLRWTNQGSESSNYHHRMTLVRMGTNGGLHHSEIADLLTFGVKLMLYQEKATFQRFQEFLKANFPKKMEEITRKKRERIRYLRSLQVPIQDETQMIIEPDNDNIEQPLIIQSDDELWEIEEDIISQFSQNVTWREFDDEHNKTNTSLNNQVEEDMVTSQGDVEVDTQEQDIDNYLDNEEDRQRDDYDQEFFEELYRELEDDGVELDDILMFASGGSG